MKTPGWSVADRIGLISCLGGATIGALEGNGYASAWAMIAAACLFIAVRERIRRRRVEATAWENIREARRAATAAEAEVRALLRRLGARAPQ